MGGVLRRQGQRDNGGRGRQRAAKEEKAAEKEEKGAKVAMVVGFLRAGTSVAKTIMSTVQACRWGRLWASGAHSVLWFVL